MTEKTVIVMGTGAGNMRALTGDGTSTAAITDPIATAPDLTGPHGRAWKCNLVEGRRLAGIAPEDDAALVHWVIEAPWAHPAWHSYSLMLIHLRPLAPHLGTTRFYLPCATHEMWLYALDPQKDRRPLIATGMRERHWLQPGNFAAQFTEASDPAVGDADALARIARTVQEICDGVLSPDTDFKREWIARFGDAMVRKEYR